MSLQLHGEFLGVRHKRCIGGRFITPHSRLQFIGVDAPQDIFFNLSETSMTPVRILSTHCLL